MNRWSACLLVIGVALPVAVACSDGGPVGTASGIYAVGAGIVTPPTGAGGDTAYGTGTVYADGAASGTFSASSGGFTTSSSGSFTASSGTFTGSTGGTTGTLSATASSGF